jgi:uncharacterized protein involved in oxidation of intracellular sulfur
MGLGLCANRRQFSLLAEPALRRGSQVGLCGTCMDARGINEGKIVEGARRSSLEELTDWSLWADQVVTF